MTDTPSSHKAPIDHRDIKSIPARSPYPPPDNDAFHPDMQCKMVGTMPGLTHFGVNFVTLPPSGKSSERHWHKVQDEFVYVIEGKITIVTAAGETPFPNGHSVGFSAGVEDGHMLENKSDLPATFMVVVGPRKDEVVTFSDHDLVLDDKTSGPVWQHRNGVPYG